MWTRVFLGTFAVLLVVFALIYLAVQGALYLRVQQYPARLAEFRHVIDDLTPSAVVLAIVLSALIAAGAARVIAKPVTDLSRMSRRVAAMDLTARTRATRHDEIGDLGRDLNTLAARLDATLGDLTRANAALRDDVEREQELKRQRTDLFTTVAHELKTPLTILRGEISGMIDGIGVYADRDTYLQHALETTAGMERLVHSVLLLARLESVDAVVQRAPVDLGALVARQCATLEDLALRRGVDIVAFTPAGTFVAGDAAQLDFAVSNVIGNAVKHSPAGDIVEVELQACDDAALLRVSNTGTIADDDAARLTTEAGTGGRFQSSGFGLSIVRRVLLAHDVGFGLAQCGDQVTFTARFSLAKP